jgi:uncharacterized protein
LAVLLSGTSVVGAVAGTVLNAYVSRRAFGIVLGVLIVATGVLLLYRQLRGLASIVTVDAATPGGRLAFAVLGFGLGVVSGLVGIGGPVLAVPAMVVLGVPMLLALGVAQVQAIFISGFAAGGYFLQDAISPAFASIIGGPLVVGAAGGWLIAHRIDPGRLEVALGIVLLPTGVYLML